MKLINLKKKKLKFNSFENHVFQHSFYWLLFYFLNQPNRQHTSINKQFPQQRSKKEINPRVLFVQRKQKQKKKKTETYI